MKNYDKKEIEEKANNILRELGFLNSCNPDIVVIARHFGFRVGESEQLPYVINGFLHISKDKTKKIICINHYRYGESQRFTVAQMLARYFLYYENVELEDFVRYKEYKKSHNLAPKETEIDYFANCLLAPKKEFASVYNALKENGHDEWDTIHHLKDIFRLTKESIHHRIEDVKAGVSRSRNENSTKRASLGSIIKNFTSKCFATLRVNVKELI